jgi:PAS domain S-box-containing protein
MESVTVKDLSGVIIFWNAGASKLYGWTLDEVIGRKSSDIIRNTIEFSVAKDMEEAIAQGLCWTGRFEVTKKDGKKLFVFAANHPIYDDENVLIGVLETSVDIPAKDLNYQTGSIAIAHELRRPVAGLLKIIWDGMKDVPNAKEKLEALHSTANSLQNFASDRFRLDNEWSVCNIRETLQSLIHNLNQEANVVISLSISSDIAQQICIMSTILLQIFRDILTHSFKSTDAGTRIECRVFCACESRKQMNLNQTFLQKHVIEDCSSLIIAVSHNRCNLTDLCIQQCQLQLESIGCSVWIPGDMTTANCEIMFAIPYTLPVKSEDSDPETDHDNPICGIKQRKRFIGEETPSVKRSRSDDCSDLESCAAASADYFSTQTDSLTSSILKSGNDSSTVYTENSSIAKNNISDDILRQFGGWINVVMVDDDPICRKVGQKLLSHYDVHPLIGINGQEGRDLVINQTLANKPVQILFTDVNSKFHLLRINTIFCIFFYLFFIYFYFLVPIMNGYDSAMELKTWFQEKSQENFLLGKDKMVKPLIVAVSSNCPEELIREAKRCDIWHVESKPLTTAKLQRILLKAIPLLLLPALDT